MSESLQPHCSPPVSSVQPPSKGLMHVLLHSVPPTLQQATTNPRLCWRLLDTARQASVSLLWGHCSFLLDSGAHKVVCALQESVSQSRVSSGGSMVGLLATSSKNNRMIISKANRSLLEESKFMSLPVMLKKLRLNGSMKTYKTF